MNYLKRELYELIRSEAFIFDFVQESSLDGLWYWDLENPENEWMNPRFWTTLGYNPDQMPHRADAWQHLIHPEDLEVATQNALRHWQDPSHPYDQVVRYRHKNGSTVWIRCRGLAIRDGQGKPVRMLGAHTDITQVKQQEAELLKANARLKELLNNTGDMVFVLDEAYTFIEYYRNNDQDSSLFVPPSFFIGKKVHEIGFPPEAERAITNALRAALATGSKQSVEYALPMPQEEQWYSLAVSALPRAAEQKRELICVARNITESKRAEVRVRESEKLLELFFSNSLDGFFFMMLDEPVVWDAGVDKKAALDYVFAHQRITRINQAMLDQYGARQEDFLGLTPNDFFAHDPDHGREVWTGLFDQGRLRIDSDERRFDGSPMWVEGDYLCLYDDAGRITGHFGVQRDITRRKELEKELLAKTQELEGFFDTALDLLFIGDMQGNFGRVNKTAERIFGFTPEELHGTSVLDLIHPEDKPQALEKLADLHAGVQVQDFVVRCRRKDGTYTHVEWCATTKGERIYAAARDITERLQAEEKLAKERILLRTIIDNIPVNIYVKDTLSRKVLANRAEYEYVQASGEEEILGKDDYQLYPDESARLSVDEDQQVLRTGKAILYQETLNTRLDGSQCWFLSSKIPLLDARSQTTGLVGISLDITGIKLAQIALQEAYNELQVSEEELRARGEELSAMNEMMEQTISDLRMTQAQLVQSEKMASLGQLTAGIAHEINNPINFVYAGTDNIRQALDELYQVLGQLEEIENLCREGEKMDFRLLQEKLSILEEMKKELYYQENRQVISESILSVKTGAARTAEIVKGLRNFSRLDEAALKNIDIHEGLESTLILLSNRLKDRIRLVKEYDESLPFIECFPGQLNQVFMNILVNAIQAIEGEGQLSITTRNCGDEVEVVFADTGKGISEEVLPRIFDPFFTTKPVGEGTGLGLSISYGIIRKHNGTLSVNSTPGKGTAFLIRLPKTFSGPEIEGCLSPREVAKKAAGAG